MSTKVIFAILTMTLVFACTPSEKETPTQLQPTLSLILPDAPGTIVDSIRNEFPNAAPAHVYADSLLGYISKKYGITADQVLLGASTCVDDIIYTKNFKTHQEIKGPFHLGGLAGLPFTGISGLSAFAHHIPENGTMLLLIAPHIGYTTARGWGYVLRSGQDKPSTCCGALMGTLQKFERGVLKQTKPMEEDYQGIIINNMALQYGKEIRGHHNPLVTLTKIVYREAERQILDQVQLMETEDIKYIVVMAGVLINTDYEYTDYLWLNHFSVYDVQKKVFLENKKSADTE